jgi:hypothetical protein
VTEARLDLVWDFEPYDASVHYDLLVRSPDGTTTSLAVTVASDGLPWPLRGAQRVGDKVLLEVDGERLDVADAVSCLDAIADDVDIVDRLLDTGIVRRELARPVTVSMPRSVPPWTHPSPRRPRSAADTLRWMEVRGAVGVPGEGGRPGAAPLYVVASKRKPVVVTVPLPSGSTIAGRTPGSRGSALPRRGRP